MINLTINTKDNLYKIKCEKGTSLKEVIKNENINFIFPCGGVGRCGNCKVKVLKGNENATKLDKIKLSKLDIDKGFRLACCMKLENDLEIFLSEITLDGFLDL